MATDGKIIGIARREKSRAPMEEIDAARVTIEMGLEGDYRGRPGQRQFTILRVEDWRAACAELSLKLDWTTRRANLLVEGIDLPMEGGAIVRLGDCEVQITGETDPCKRMEEAQSGLFAALDKDWRGGRICRVLKSGHIEIGDGVELLGDGPGGDADG